MDSITLIGNIRCSKCNHTAQGEVELIVDAGEADFSGNYQVDVYLAATCQCGERITETVA